MTQGRDALATNASRRHYKRNQNRFRLYELVSVFVDFLYGVGDVVDVGLGSEQHVLAEPDGLFAELVVD